MYPSLSIIVPSHNESDNLRRLIPELTTVLRSVNGGYEIIVVDNASTDNTQETLRELALRFTNMRSVYEGEKGFGRALLSGFREAKGGVLGYIHADNQMSPSEVVRIYDHLRKENLDVSKATRINRSDGTWRFIVSRVYNLLFRIMFGVRLRDINGSPKLFTKRFFDTAKLDSKDWFIDPEILIKAKRLNMSVGEVPIRTFKREAGISQVRLGTIVEFVKNMLRYWRHPQS